MANQNAPMGFRLILDGGHEAKRRQRSVASGNTTVIAPGDAITIIADGTVIRCDGSTPPNGIVEGLALQGVNEGPVSYDFLPANVAGLLICIEDPTAEFEVQSSTAIPLSDYDTGAEVNVVDAAPSQIPAQSRQQIGAAGGNQLRLIQPIDRPLNDQFAINAKVRVGLLPSNVQ